jgi:hypothetical protein
MAGREELIDALLVERYQLRPRRTHIEDTPEAQARRRAELAAAVKDFEIQQSTTEQKRAAKRRRHLRAIGRAA